MLSCNRVIPERREKMKKVFLEKRKEVIAIFLATILTISLSCSSGSSYNGGLGGTDIVTFDQVKTEIERGLESTLRSPSGTPSSFRFLL